MEHVRWAFRPELRTPVLVAGFAGWNDAGDAATLAVRHLVETFGAVRFASIDPEEFHDFQQSRPQVRLSDGVTREVVWPEHDFYAASTPGGDVVLLLGTEPQLRWRTFCDQVLAVANDLDVRLVITLGALLADVPHRRPVAIIGTATGSDLIARFGLQRSRYEGPTGIVGVLHDACAKASVDSVSLWAAVPAYAPGTPSPKAALGLVDAAAGLLGTPIAPGGLASSTREYVDEVDEIVATDDDLEGYVRRLEAMADSDDEDEFEDEVEDETALDQPAGVDRLVEELERYLRDQGRD